MRTVCIACGARRPQPARSISGSRHDRSNHGSSGPHRRTIGNHDLPGSVGIQFAAPPSGSVGPNRSTIAPSSSAATVPERLEIAGYSVDWRRDRVCVS